MRFFTRFFLVLFPAILLSGCGSALDETSAPAPQALNGIWESNCILNEDTGYYEIVEYDIDNTLATIVIESYHNRSCTQLSLREVFEGTVSQTNSIILGNGLEATQLSFSGYDANLNLTLNHTAYFQSESFYLYEYPNPNNNLAYEYVRIL